MSKPQRRPMQQRQLEEMAAIGSGKSFQEVFTRSLEAQWERVELWRQELADSEDYPVLSSLEYLWSVIEPEQRVVDRKDVRVADSPLAALMYFIECGFYPPPELLLGLLDTWEAYMGMGGDIDLEEAFFGKPIRKAGNYSKRKFSRLKKLDQSFKMDRLIRDGMTKAKAAEKVSEETGVDPETIARQTRVRVFSARNGQIKAGINPRHPPK